MLFKRTFISIAIMGLIVVPLTVAGCSSGDSNVVEVQVETAQKGAESKDGLDPLTRGKVRRQILNDTKENIAIWLKGDIDNLEKAFTKDLFKAYKPQIDKLHAKGQDKIRIHENQDFEVVELKQMHGKLYGTVKYNFTDKSYFISKKTKKTVKGPANTESEIEIKVEEQDGHWKIWSMIGSSEGTL